MVSLLLLLKARILFKLVQILAISSLKFIVAPPVSIEMGFNYAETILVTTAGGILGVFFFYHLSGGLIKWYRLYIKPWISHKFRWLQSRERRVAHAASHHNNRPKRIFTWKNKLLVRIRRKWGLWGIALLTPSLLSIPLGSFLANKYYSKNKHTLMYLSMSVIFWSFIFSTVYFFGF